MLRKTYILYFNSFKQFYKPLQKCMFFFRFVTLLTSLFTAVTGFAPSVNLAPFKILSTTFLLNVTEDIVQELLNSENK